MRALSVLSVLMPLVAACGAPALDDGFETSLTERGGCADVVFYAVDAADETLLTVRADGLIEAAGDATEPVVTPFDLPDPGITLTVEQGTRISDAICDDVIENGGPQVVETWTAVGGTAVVTVQPADGDDEPSADLSLSEVVFESSTGAEAVLQELVIEDVVVGWFAG